MRDYVHAKILCINTAAMQWLAGVLVLYAGVSSCIWKNARVLLELADA